MVEYGYVSASFPERDVDLFQGVVRETCKEGDFYRSDVIEYINGDVSSDLHLTIFYGLINDKVNRLDLEKHIQGIELKKLNLGKLILMQRHKDLYQILAVEVLDKDKSLEAIANSFTRFPYEESVQLGFMPHLTLAYVRPEFKLVISPDFPKEIVVKGIRYFEK